MITKANMRIGGVAVNLPVDWQSISINGSFNSDNASSSIETDQIKLVLEAAREVINYVDAGTSGGFGVTVGQDVELELVNNDGTINVFRGIIDFTDGFEILDSQTVSCKLKALDSLALLKQRMEGTTVDYLESQKIYNQNDYIKINYLVEPDSSILEIALLGLTIYLLQKEVAESIRRTGEAAATASGIISGSFTGTIGAAVFLVAKAIIELAYTVFMAIQIIKLVKQLSGELISPTRQFKGISLYSLVSKAIGYYGYSLNTDIKELKEYVYLPSKTLGRSNNSGLPTVSDFGYTVSEAIELCEQLFDAKTVITGNEFHLRPRNDPFWRKKSTYILTEISREDSEKVAFNLDELKTGYYLKFELDPSDFYTLREYKGAAFTVATQNKKQNNINRNLIRGFEEEAFPLALGNAKIELNDLESAMSGLIDAANAVLKIFGGSVTNPVKNRKGMLKISQNTTSRAKLLYLSGGKIPTNHRDKLSAKYLWDRFHNRKSFVANNFGGQYQVFKNVRIPLTFSDYQLLISNNFITDWKGREAEITEVVKWSFDSDTAIVNFKVKQKYTDNLIEIKTEPI